MQSGGMKLLVLAAFFAQSTANPPDPVTPSAPSATVAGPAVIAKAGTPLRLMVWNEVSTRSVKVGDRYLLVLDTAVSVDGKVVIARGARAWGEVVAARSSGMGGRAGELETRLLHLETGGGEVPIAPATAAALADKGRNAALQMVMATAALTPWGPFARGNNARLKAGHIVEAVLGADVLAPTPRP